MEATAEVSPITLRVSGVTEYKEPDSEKEQKGSASPHVKSVVLMACTSVPLTGLSYLLNLSLQTFFGLSTS